MISERIQKRFLQDPLPIRLGGLAADLARIASCADDVRDREALLSLLEEGKWFAEWAAAPDAPFEVQEILAQVQLKLAQWHRRWLAGKPDPAMRTQAQWWSGQLLELSGLHEEKLTHER